MADSVKNYMWFPVLIALFYTIYTNDIYKNIFFKLITGNVSGAYNIYYNYSDNNNNNEQIFTHDELKKFVNSNYGYYLAILGNVFDVSSGENHYGVGASYHGFVGKDATLAFVTGEFNEKGWTDDISSITDSQAKSIDGWIKFYEEKYQYKGKLIGRFYDKNGNPTAELKKFQGQVDNAKVIESLREEQKKKFPPCNVEWKPESGTQLWCTKLSGGVSRDWIGVPKQFFEDPTSGQSRCACVNLESNDYHENQGKFRNYEKCSNDFNICYLKV